MLNDFDDKLFRELVNAIFDFGFEEKDTAETPLVQIAMKLIKPQILRDWEKYSTRCEQLRNNGAKGGRPKKENQMVSEKPIGFEKTNRFSENQMVSDDEEKPNGYIYNNDNINNNDNDNVNDNIEIIKDTKVSSSEAPINYGEIIDFFNEQVRGKGISSCIKLTDKRRKAVSARLREFGKEKVFLAIQKACESSFLNGRNDRNFHADFDFVFNANKMARILEGKYDDETGRTDYRDNDLWSRTEGYADVARGFRDESVNGEVRR